MKQTLFIVAILLLLQSCAGPDNSGSASASTDTISNTVTTIDTPPQSAINVNELDTLTKRGERLTVNGIVCYWKFTGGSYDTSETGNGTIQLIETSTGKILLSNSDEYTVNEVNSLDPRGSFIDINFDGLKDFVASNRLASGSAGDYRDIFLFDRKSRKFNHSEALSSTNLEIDSINKILSSHFRIGGEWSARKVHFGNGGKVSFVEEMDGEPIPGDHTLWKTTYTKTVNKKVVSRKTDTSEAQGFSDRSDTPE